MKNVRKIFRKFWKKISGYRVTRKNYWKTFTEIDWTIFEKFEKHFRKFLKNFWWNFEDIRRKLQRKMLEFLRNYWRCWKNFGIGLKKFMDNFAKMPKIVGSYRRNFYGNIEFFFQYFYNFRVKILVVFRETLWEVWNFIEETLAYFITLELRLSTFEHHKIFQFTSEFRIIWRT